MTSPKQLALQLAAAMPDDASLEDYEEFLFERGQVERGRRDLLSMRAEPPTAAIASVAAAWSRTAADGYRELASVASAAQLEDRVTEALVRIASDPRSGVSLPEMADPSVLEVPVLVGTLRCRLVYEHVADKLRILWFTNNVTCYRNVRPAARQS